MSPSPAPAADHQQPTSNHPLNPHEAAVQPSGPRADNPATAGRGQTAVRSSTPQNSAGRLNPSAPGETGTTPDPDK